ncbi:MAG TPA: replicative DNA helicase [Clostridiales bacterium]|nr:replicative DNA helicase [Clostridiales bacterium]
MDAIKGIMPPCSMEAEQSVLGCMLLSKEAVSRAAEVLKPEDFYHEGHKEIFEAMLDIYEEGEPVDLVTLTERLRMRNSIDAVGGITYITNLSTFVPTAANIEYYIKIVEEKSILRRLIKLNTQVIEYSYSGGLDIDQLLDMAEKGIFDISQRHSVRGFTPIQDILLDNFNRIEQLYKDKSKITGIPTGFPDIDYKTSGFQPSDLILIAARPSMGKTAFALNIAQYAALHAQKSVAIFSLEMSKEQLVNRMLCSEANIDSHRMRTGNLDENDWPRLAMAVGPLAKAPIYIDDTPAISVLEMRSKARRLKLERGLDIIIVDYLQLMQGRGRADNRQQEISEISRSLKALARELDVPVVALSQLSRAPETRNDHRPILSDLRESGAIEQDADLVMFLYRDEYYNPDTDKKNIAEIIIAKQRNGPTGTVELVWLDQFTKFASLERHRTEIE